MDNIRIIKTGLKVDKILNQLKEFPQDWGGQCNIENSYSMLNYGFPEVDAGVLQLIMGVVTSMDQYVGDSEFSKPTPAYYHHTRKPMENTKAMKNTIKWINEYPGSSSGNIGKAIKTIKMMKSINTCKEQPGNQCIYIIQTMKQ